MESFLQRTIHGVPEKFLNPQLYIKAKQIADETHKKSSAYKSMFIMEEYKKLGGKIDESKSKHGLRKWIDEDWKNLTPYSMGLTTLESSPKCGQKHPSQGKIPSVCRPKNQIHDFTKAQIQRAVKIKEKGDTIRWKDL
jgi:hypothetical protein